MRSPLGGTLYEAFKNKNRKLPGNQSDRMNAEKRQAQETPASTDEQPAAKSTKYDDMGKYSQMPIGSRGSLLMLVTPCDCIHENCCSCALLSVNFSYEII